MIPNASPSSDGLGASGAQAPCDHAFARALAPVVVWAGLLAVAVLGTACAASTHAIQAARLGHEIDVDAFEAALDRPGPVRFERVVAADWVVARSGLVNLDHEAARAAGLEDGDEPIEIFFYVLEHPTEGDFIVDSGVSRDFTKASGSDDVGALVEAVMNTEALDVHVPMADWVAARSNPLAGVLLTHIHLDHIMGLPDIPEDVPVYVGPGETLHRSFLNLFTQGTLDRFLERPGALREWSYPPRAAEDQAAPPVRVLDVFGEGSLFALHVPGHTPGSMAFVVRSTDGPKLLVGDTSHTAWGWRNGVEPGSFTADHDANARSLAWLRGLADRHPGLEVHLGHQRLATD